MLRRAAAQLGGRNFELRDPPFNARHGGQIMLAAGNKPSDQPDACAVAATELSGAVDEVGPV